MEMLFVFQCNYQAAREYLNEAFNAALVGFVLVCDFYFKNYAF